MVTIADVYKHIASLYDSNMMLCMFMAFHVVTFGPTSQYTDDAIMWNILPLLCLLGKPYDHVSYYYSY